MGSLAVSPAIVVAAELRAPVMLESGSNRVMDEAMAGALAAEILLMHHAVVVDDEGHHAHAPRRAG